MSRNAFVFAPEDTGAPWRWCVPGDGGEFATGEGLHALAAARTAEDPSAANAFDDVVLILAGEAVFATRLTVPTRSRRQIEATLPFLAEEGLAEDIELLHLVSNYRAENGTVPVRAVAPIVLQDALEQIADAGLRVCAAHVDFDALEDEQDALNIWLGASRALVSHSSASFAVLRDDLPGFITALLQDMDEVVRIRIGVTADADSELLEGQLRALLQTRSGIEIDRTDLGDRLITSLTVAFASRAARMQPALDLLTGPFKQERRREGPRPRWGLAAGLLAGWFILQLGLDAGRTAWLEARTETLREENLELFRSIVPNRTRSPDPRRELETMLVDRTESSASFMGLIGVVASELQGGGRGTTLRGLNWNAQRGDLAVDLTVPGITQVDRLKAALDGGGYPVTIDSAVQEQAGVRARIRVREGGGR